MTDYLTTESSFIPNLERNTWIKKIKRRTLMNAEWTMIFERFHTTGFTNFLLMMVVYGLYGIGNQLKVLNKTAWRGVYKDDLGD